MVRPRHTRLSVPDAFPPALSKPGALPSALRSQRLTSQLGLWLGVAFAVCFVTGLVSHTAQHPAGWPWWPTRPVWLYRVTQGMHVATGLAAVPLLGAKLWSVYPKLFTRPVVRDPAHALERAGVAVLVGTALFQVVTGVLNVARWYAPMGFFFTTAHYWTGWLAVGALLLHVAVQLPVTRAGLTRAGLDRAGLDRGGAPPEPPTGGLSRRGLLRAIAAGSGVITVTTAGQTVPALDRLSVLAPRRPAVGPQRLPVNRSAGAASVIAAAVDPGYRLRITGPSGTRLLSLAELAALPQHTASLPITCVEGWSADAVWTGVRIADLLALAGVADGADRVGMADGADLVGMADRDMRVRVESLQQDGRYRTSTLGPAQIRDPLTLLALRLHDQPLSLDHGFPARLIAPNRPGVLQTKWVAALTVVTR